MAGKIFINYRRGDDPGHTGRLFDRLQDVFQPEQLFLDVDNIAPVMISLAPSIMGISASASCGFSARS
jgi:hypothetical protein